MPISTFLSLRLSFGLSLAAPAEPPPDSSPEPSAASTPASVIAPGSLDGATGLDADALVRAEELAYAGFMDGQRALEEGDVEEARRLWVEAIATLPDERPYAGSRGALAMWMVLAAQAEYVQDGSLEALRSEVSLLRGWLVRLPELEPDDARRRDELQALVEGRVQAVEDQIAWELAEHGDADTQLAKSLEGEYQERSFGRWRPPTALLAWRPRPDDPRAHVVQVTEQEAAPEELVLVEGDQPRPRGAGLLVGGSITLAAGVGGVVVGVLGMRNAAAANDFDAAQTPAERRIQMSEGERANVTAVAGLCTGGALLVTGVTLLAVGAKRRRGRLRVAPEASAQHLGLSIGGRF